MYFLEFLTTLPLRELDREVCVPHCSTKIFQPLFCRVGSIPFFKMFQLESIACQTCCTAITLKLLLIEDLMFFTISYIYIIYTIKSAR